MIYENVPPVSRLGMICREICERGSPQGNPEDWRFLFLKVRKDKNSEKGIVIIRYFGVEILRMEENRFEEIDYTDLKKEYLTDEEVERACNSKMIADVIREDML